MAEATKKNLKGLYNLSGSQRVNRYEILKKIKYIFKLNNKLIPCSIDDFKMEEKRPKDVSLSNSVLKKKLGYNFKKIDLVIKKIKSQINH